MAQVAEDLYLLCCSQSGAYVKDEMENNPINNKKWVDFSKKSDIMISRQKIIKKSPQFMTAVFLCRHRGDTRLSC